MTEEDRIDHDALVFLSSQRSPSPTTTLLTKFSTKCDTTTSVDISPNARDFAHSCSLKKLASCTHQINTPWNSSLKTSFATPSFMLSTRFVKGSLNAIETLF